MSCGVATAALILGSGLGVETAKAQSATAFETAEYFSSNFLAPINASTAYAAGFTGNGSLIAIIDDGFLSTHIDLAPNLSTLGTANVALHGTHVAAIAASANNGIGSHGVAYNAGLILGTYLGGQAPASFLASAALGANVISNSWGTDVNVNAVLAQPNVDTNPAAALNATLGVGSAYWQTYLDALDVAQASSVIAWAATNNAAFTDIDVSAGMPLVDPRLAEAWITVVNVNPGDAITYTQFGGATISHSAGELVSGPCGSAMTFCMAAPGVQANSAVSSGNNDFGRLFGTSMATPMVAGAVAIASEMFPDATPAQLAQLVMQTSTDIGAPGVDGQFGWGLLNLANLTAVADPSTAQMGPVTQASQVSTLNAFMDVMNAQMGMPGATGSGNEALGFAAREGSPLEDIFPIRGEITRRAWLSPMGEYLHVDDGATWNGYQTRSGGLALGFELSREEQESHWRIGAALGLSYADAEGDNGSSDSETTGFHVGVYGGLANGPWEFDGSLQLAYLQQEQARHRVAGIGAINQTANSSYDSVAAEANARVGHAFDLIDVTLTPFVSAEARIMRIDGYSETGAGVFNLTVASDTIAQLEVGPGLRIERTLSTGENWEFVGSLDAAYSYVLGDHSPTSQATLLGRTINSTRVDLGRHVATLGTELALQNERSGITATLRYEGRFRENALSHSLAGDLSIPF